MLPFKNRLTKRKDFEKVQDKGEFFSLQNVAIKALPNETKETRIGFVVGMKFSKKAVERNFVKRQLRDAFQPELNNLRKGFDIVVMVRRREGEKITIEKLKQNVKELLEKSQLFKQ